MPLYSGGPGWKLIAAILAAFICLTTACDYSSYRKNKDTKKETTENSSGEKASENTPEEKAN